MKKVVDLLVGGIIAIAIPSAHAANTWDGGGANANWDTPANWDDNLVPASGADVTIGSVFTSGTNIMLNGNRTVGHLTFDLGGTANRALYSSTNTLTVNSGITKTAVTGAGTADIFSALNLPNDIVINQGSTGRIGLRGVISGAGRITLNFTAASASSLFLGTNNSGWSGGLSVGAAPANSSITVVADGALGTGSFSWTAANGPVLNFGADTNFTIGNTLNVVGSQIIQLSTANSSNKTIKFNGNINGTGSSILFFTPRQDTLTNLTVELNAANTNADAASRFSFVGSTNALGERGVTYLIGHNNALNWGRVVLGQTTAAVEDINFLYKDGITISRMVELNDSDGGAVQMGVSGTNSSATHNANIVLSNFDALGKTKAFSLHADEGSTFTVTGTMVVNSPLDTLHLTKVGSGTVALNGTGGSLYSGTTTVAEGTLLINNTTGSGSGTGTLLVEEGATLGGSGRIAPTAGNNVVIEGTLSPGNSPGTMTFAMSGASKLVFEENSILAFELGTSSDLINFTTSGDWLSGSGNAILALTLGDGFDYGQTYTIFSGVTTSGFTFADITGYDSGVYTANFTQFGNSYQLSFVPEPGTIMFALLGGGLVLFRLRRKTS